MYLLKTFQGIIKYYLVFAVGNVHVEIFLRVLLNNVADAVQQDVVLPTLFQVVE